MWLSLTDEIKLCGIVATNQAIVAVCAGVGGGGGGGL